MIPDKVKIGIYEYEVIETGEVLVVNNEVCTGTINFNELQIKIDKSLPSAKKQQVLWHEIFHGMVREWGCNLADEENTVDWLAKGMIQLIKDNPKLFEFKNMFLS